MAALPFPAGVVAVAGSRRLPRGAQCLVEEAVWSLLESRHRRLVIGCCRGADHAALAAAPGGLAQVFAAFGPGGEGASRWSAVAGVQRHAREGGRVRWWAGGGPAVPLSTRLAGRTRTVVAQASAGLVVFFASPSSRGSLLAARCALARGLPVVAFAVGFSPAVLPSLGAGRWASLGGRGVWAQAWRWVPAQEALFVEFD